MSIVTALARQSLIAQKNNLQYQMLNNSMYRRSLLSNPYFCGDLSAINSQDKALSLSDISASCQLAAINAELNSLSESGLNYLA